MAPVLQAPPLSACGTQSEKPPSSARAPGRNPKPLDALETHRRSGQGGQSGAAGLGRLLPLSKQHVGDGRDETIQPRPVAPMDLAQTRLPARPVELLPGRATAYALWPLRIADDCGLESCPMNEFGEPNMGNPSVRFDEGWESVGHWPCASQSILSRLLYRTESERV